VDRGSLGIKVVGPSKRQVILGLRLADCLAYISEASSQRMRIAGQHRLYSVPRNLGQISIIDACSPHMRDVAVAALVGADV
jgi:hypothetical protein